MERKYRISTYEWDMLESNGHLAGMLARGWYEWFLATNDTEYLERLLTFWRPPERDVRLLAEYSREDFLSDGVRLLTDTRLLHAIAQHPEKMWGLEWRAFEGFVAELLVQLGYDNVKLGPGTRDGGIDISANLPHPVGVERIIVECKRYDASRRVGSPTIKQLLGTIELSKASRGLVVTTSSLTRPAQLLVNSYSHRLSALDGQQLQAMLRGIVPDRRDVETWNRR